MIVVVAVVVVVAGMAGVGDDICEPVVVGGIEPVLLAVAVLVVDNSGGLRPPPLGPLGRDGAGERPFVGL